MRRRPALLQLGAMAITALLAMLGGCEDAGMRRLGSFAEGTEEFELYEGVEAEGECRSDWNCIYGFDLRCEAVPDGGQALPPPVRIERPPVLEGLYCGCIPPEQVCRWFSQDAGM